ncbi:MAG: winged helix DNA-binding domain-containing protein, partial [Acidimicrobiales bacterium]
MPRNVSTEERRARLAVRHRLAPSARGDDDLVAVARSVVALHATDPATVVLSAMARMQAPDPDAVARALYDDVLLVRMMAMRRTMFTCAVDDAALLQRSSGDAVAASERKKLLALLQEQRVSDDPAGWLAATAASALAAVEAAGELAATELTKAVPALGVRVTLGAGTKHAVTGGVTSRVLTLMGLEGQLVRGRPKGRWTSSQHRWASLTARLGGPLAAIPVEDARAELVRRWLDRFGPGTIADLKWWTGWTMGATRAAVAALDTEEVDVDGTPALVLAGDAEPVEAPEPWVALLPGLDPTPMGWKDRGWYLGEHKAHVFDTNGNVGPTIWVDGRIAGGWAHRKTGRVST